jgi:hypothetical protein
MKGIKTKAKKNGYTKRDVQSMTATQILRKLSEEELDKLFTWQELLALIARYRVENESKKRKSKKTV